MEARKERVARFFDEISSDYRDAYGESCRLSMRAEILQSRREVVFNLLRRERGRVLDIGCGPGVFARDLLEQGWEVWGVDISPKMIKGVVDGLSGERAERGYFLLGDIEALPLPDRFFDAVLCIGVLEYLNGCRRALKEIARVSKPGATVILSFPNRISPFNLLDRGALFLARPVLRVLEGGARMWNRDYQLPIRRRSLKGQSPGQLCYHGSIERDLAVSGLSTEKRAFHTYRSALISAFAPSASLALSQHLEKNLPRVLRWTGVDCVIRATKQGTKG
jgi:ubiquinone/menaquinone biosynthesis C-methylase UbiE